jgi:hypothetical protein
MSYDDKMVRKLKLLNVAANEAFQNSVDLLEEAKLLRDHKKWARSYALAVLAAEQFTKSFEFKCEEAAFNLEKVPPKRMHAFRLARFEQLLILPHLVYVDHYNALAKLSPGLTRKEPNRQFIESISVMFGRKAKPQRKRFGNETANRSQN